ncbi:uncharacterized protein LOC126904151 [Daktulosphaira vitifoliae]|uniref:uncharacterized protein LOC126904151 n=1 Tax=Daktulosphaira vitifoliae TaxID=58002 RepID=UPI0021AA7DDA|nr:uncharacterized protein LOC126904151 [Daktulosphaira vitifoliae]
MVILKSVIVIAVAIVIEVYNAPTSNVGNFITLTSTPLESSGLSPEVIAMISKIYPSCKSTSISYSGLNPAFANYLRTLPSYSKYCNLSLLKTNSAQLNYPTSTVNKNPDLGTTENNYLSNLLPLSTESSKLNNEESYSISNQLKPRSAPTGINPWPIHFKPNFMQNSFPANPYGMNQYPIQTNNYESNSYGLNQYPIVDQNYSIHSCSTQNSNVILQNILSKLMNTQPQTYTAVCNFIVPSTATSNSLTQKEIVESLLNNVKSEKVLPEKLTSSTIEQNPAKIETNL